MSIRPSQAKGPYVGPATGGGGGGAPADASYVTVSAEAGLSDERVLTAGSGITIVDGGPDTTVTIAVTGGPLLDVDLAGLGVATFRDEFYLSKPFWLGTDAILTGNWTVDTVNHRITRAAGAVDNRNIRENVEGDYDYAMKMTLVNNSAGNYVGFGTHANTYIRIISTASGTIEWSAETGGTGSVVIATVTAWLRIVRRGRTLRFFYKLADADPWTLITTQAGQTDEIDKALYLISKASTTGDYASHVILTDNKGFEQVRSHADNEVPLTESGGAISIDASKGNCFTFAITGTPTIINAPTNPMRNQKMILVIKQGAGGSKTVSWNAAFRFSDDLPTPTLSTTAGDQDYFGFRYHETDAKWDLIAEVKGF